MVQAETQADTQGSDLSDYIIAILGAALFGAIVGTVIFWLIAGYQFAANEFLNIYPPDDANIDFWIRFAYTWSPVAIGLLATYPAYRFLLKLK